MLPVRQLKNKTLVNCDAHKSTARIETAKNSQCAIKRRFYWRIARNICTAFGFAEKDGHNVKWPNVHDLQKSFWVTVMSPRSAFQRQMLPVRPRGSDVSSHSELHPKE